MSVPSNPGRVSYVGNGATSVYSYGCRIYSATDLRVTKRLISTGAETPLVLTTDYTVDGIGNTSGNITLVAGALPSTYKLVIRRVRPLTQTTSFRNQSTFYGANHEDALDKVVMVQQQQQDGIDRSVKLPETFYTSDFNPTLPLDLVGSASKVFGTDPTGAFLITGPSFDQISQAQGYANAAAASAALAAGGGWAQTSFTYTQLSAAALNNAITAFTLPSNSILDTLILKHTTAFSGGGIGSVKLQVGISGDNGKFIDNFDAYQAVSDTAFELMKPSFLGSFATPTVIQLNAIATGANLNGLVAGAVTLYYQVFTI